MDSLDIKIMRQLVEERPSIPLQTEIHKPYRKVARQLGVDEETVRARIKKLQGSGFLRGWSLVVNPHLLGGNVATIAFDAPSPSSKDDLIRKFKLMHGAWVIVSHYGSSMGVILFYENEGSLKKEIELISRISNTENLSRAEVPFPECPSVLTRTDWRIIRSLLEDPRRQFNLVAKELDLSSRTVNRRIGGLIQSHSIFVIPKVNPKALRGAIVADLVISYTEPKYKKELDEGLVSHLDNCLMRAETGDKEHALFVLILSNVAEADEIIRWVREQRGIARAELHLVQERIELYGKADELLKRRIDWVLATAE